MRNFIKVLVLCKKIGSENVLKATKEANFDFLTKLYNRREFYRRIEEEEVRTSRYEEVFSVIFFDVDGLKKINNELGHDKGDEVLQFVASVIKKEKRKIDVAARWGGDEFLVLLPCTEKQEAEILAQRINLVINREGVSLSYGISTFEKGMSVDELIRRADEKMYRSREE